jgi:predicted flavoprotein YhiN
MIYDIAILGAGASGLMANSFLSSHKVVMIDQNRDIGEKLKICGGGKCNITNKTLSSSNYLSDHQQFIQNILDKFDNNSMLEFLDNYNIKTVIKDAVVKNQYFLNSSKDIINLFHHKIKQNKTKLYLKETIQDIEFKDDIFYIKTSNLQTL